MILVFDAYTPLRYFFLALGLVAFVAEAWAFIDAISRPSQAFVAAVVGLYFGVFGSGVIQILPVAAFVAAAIYLTDVRPKVKDFPKNRSSSGPYGPW